jgi:hypothetical protein
LTVTTLDQEQESYLTVPTSLQLKGRIILESITYWVMAHQVGLGEFNKRQSDSDILS